MRKVSSAENILEHSEETVALSEVSTDRAGKVSTSEKLTSENALSEPTDVKP
jgi:hypothetical protein